MTPLKTVKITLESTDWVLNEAPSNFISSNGYDFYVNQDIDDVDYWIVYNDLPEKKQHAYCHPENIIFVSGEPPGIRSWNKSFLSQFSTVVSCDQNLPHSNIIFAQILDYRKNDYYDFNTLKTIEMPQKTKLMSIMSSTKKKCKGHVLRLNFAKKIKEHFGNKVDLFGYGLNEIPCKWDALAPYKYHVAIENVQLNHSWTEKIMDPLLAWCHPIYYGAPNITDYFDSNAFSIIDIKDEKMAIQQIEKIIADDCYAHSLPTIDKERQKMFNDYSVFTRLSKILDGIEPIHQKTTNKESITLCKHSFLNRFFI